jgi:sugar phosphate permease
MRVYGIDRVQAASIVSLGYLGTIFGVPLVAFLSEKFQSRKKVMFYGSSITLILFSTAIFAKLDIVILSALTFSIGVSMSCQFLAFPAVLDIVSSEMAATATGFVNAITVSGSALLVPIIGKIMDFSKNNFGDPSFYSAQDYRNGMAAIPVTLAVAIGALYFIKDRRRFNSPNPQLESEKKNG